MLIAVAVAEPEEQPSVPETFEESRRLYITETEGNVTIAVYRDPGEDGILFAEKTIEHNCEAISCGRFLTAPAFNRLADACITRYYAAGLCLWEAAGAADRGELPLITDYEGGTGCGNHDRDRCAEHLMKNS